MNKYTKLCLISISSFLVVGCNTTPSSGKYYTNSSVSGLKHYYKDKVFKASAPEPISAAEMKELGMFLSDEDIKSAGSNPFRIRYLLKDLAIKVKNSANDENPIEQIAKDSSPSILTSTKDIKQFHSALYVHFSKYCLQNGGKITNEEASNLHARKSGTRHMYHICELNNQYHAYLNYSYNEENTFSQASLDSVAYRENQDIEFKESRIAHKNGGWIVTTVGELTPYDEVADFYNLEYKGTTLSLIENIVLIGEKEALIVYRDNEESLPNYDMLYLSPEKYKYGESQINYREKLNSQMVMTLAPPNTTRYGGGSEIRLSTNETNGEPLVKTFTLGGVQNSISMWLPNPPGKVQSKDDVLKIIAETQQYLFDNIDTPEKAKQFIEVFNHIDLLNLKKDAFAQIKKLEHKKHSKELSEAESIEKLLSLVLKLKKSDNKKLLAQVFAKLEQFKKQEGILTSNDILLDSFSARLECLGDTNLNKAVKNSGGKKMPLSFLDVWVYCSSSKEAVSILKAKGYKLDKQKVTGYFYMSKTENTATELPDKIYFSSDLIDKKYKSIEIPSDGVVFDQVRRFTVIYENDESLSAFKQSFDSLSYKFGRNIVNARGGNKKGVKWNLNESLRAKAWESSFPTIHLLHDKDYQTTEVAFSQTIQLDKAYPGMMEFLKNSRNSSSN